MRRRIWLPLALCAVAAVTVTAGLAGASSATAAGRTAHFQKLPQADRGPIKAGAPLPLGLSSKPVGYILELPAKPVAVVDAASKAAGNGALTTAQRSTLTQQIKTAQAPVVAAVKNLGGRVTNTFQTVYNGMGVYIAQRDAYKLSHIQGVKAVYRMKTFKPANANSVGLVGAPDTWGGVPGYTGTGMKIGDIDTGIDYTHADFGGSGNVADWTCASANSTADPSTVTCPGGLLSQWFGPSAPKVKGGIDLVGDAYNADPTSESYDPVPAPDNNPLDCNSHGTHTAGTLAGFGVLSNGATYNGPYNASTIGGNTWDVGPGVAPGASLYAIRVFGCQGSVDDSVLLAAMDWAVNNHMDVINMSLGANFGSASDPDSVAASNTAKDGVIVVSASGNAGNAPFITSSPAAGTNGIAVAANDSNATYPAATLALTNSDSSSGPTITAINANGYAFTPGTYNLKVIFNTPGDNTSGISIGCSVASDGGADSLPANTIIVVERGTCARVAKAIFGQQAGAAGVIMVNNSSSYPPFEGQITDNPDDGVPYNVTIPFLGVPGSSSPSTSENGLALIAADGGTVDLENTDPLSNPGYTYLASFSSWGPSTGGFLKPEITAPGVSVDSAKMGYGTAALYDSGTSMATPHVAGEAALVKQAHPTWKKVEFYKDAIINTANPDNVAGFNLRGAGAGEAAAYDATHTQVVASGYPQGMSSLNFGVPNMKNDYSASQYIRLRNFGSTDATFNLSDNGDYSQGADHAVTFSPSQVTVPAHSTANVQVTLSIPLSSATDALSNALDWCCYTGRFNDVGGLIDLTPATESDNGGIGLSVAYYAVPTAASAVKVRINTAQLARNGHADAVVSNIGGGGEGYADWFSLGGTSPKSNVDLGAADLISAGIQSWGSGYGSYSYTGAFAIKVNKPWTNIAADQFDVYVDVNGDNIPDYVVFSNDCSALTAGCPAGLSLVYIYAIASGSTYTDFNLAFTGYNGTTVELPFTWDDLCNGDPDPCIDPSTPITYVVQSFDRNGGSDMIGSFDESGNFTSTADPFNLFYPAFSNGTAYPGGDIVDPNSAITDTVTLNPAAASNGTVQDGFMVLAQNNRGRLNGDEALYKLFSIGAT